MRIFFKQISILFFSMIIFMGSTVKAVDSPLKVIPKKSVYNTNYINVNLKIPSISFPSNIDSENKINNTISYDIENFRKTLESEAQISYKESANENFHFIPYEAFTDFKVSYKGDKLLSIPINFYSYTGGAHGSEVLRSYVFNLSNGEKLKLSDLFIKNSNYLEIIKKNVKKSISSDPDIYFEDALKTVDKIDINQNFYITEDSIVVYYNQYDIAPYSSGIREFSLPLNLFKNILKPEFNIG